MRTCIHYGRPEVLYNPVPHRGVNAPEFNVIVYYCPHCTVVTKEDDHYWLYPSAEPGTYYRRTP